MTYPVSYAQESLAGRRVRVGGHRAGRRPVRRRRPRRGRSGRWTRWSPGTARCARPAPHAGRPGAPDCRRGEPAGDRHRAPGYPARRAATAAAGRLRAPVRPAGLGAGPRRAAQLHTTGRRRRGDRLVRWSGCTTSSGTWSPAQVLAAEPARCWKTAASRQSRGRHVAHFASYERRCGTRRTAVPTYWKRVLGRPTPWLGYRRRRTRRTRRSGRPCPGCRSPALDCLVPLGLRAAHHADRGARQPRWWPLTSADAAAAAWCSA